MNKESQYPGAFKIDLRDKTNNQKQYILNWLKPIATNYYKGHYSILEIERNFDLIGFNAFNSFTCFSVSSDNRFCAHLDDCAFIQLPYRSLSIPIGGFS